MVRNIVDSQPLNEFLNPASWTYTSRSEDQTAQLGAAIAAAVTPGTVIALCGNLGAGKTRLTRGVAAALGVEQRLVTSPTFVLIQEYEGRLPVFHFDTYRLGSVDEFLDLGVEEYFDAGGLCLIEWADRVAEVLPDDYLKIEIEIAGETERNFQFTATGPAAKNVLEKLAAAIREGEAPAEP